MFRFDYLPTEREVSVRCWPGPFALEEAESRQPSVLVLQVWDYDCISANERLPCYCLAALLPQPLALISALITLSPLSWVPYSNPILNPGFQTLGLLSGLITELIQL